jgi:predicted nucleic acid-binding protein
VGRLTRYFFDTYALISITHGKEAYRKYSECEVVTTRLNLMEAYYQLLRESDAVTAGLYYDGALRHAVDFTDADVKMAMKFRLEMKRKGLNLSYMDAMGYTIASRLKIKFLTGDREFEGLPNVEYVK